MSTSCKEMEVFEYLCVYVCVCACVQKCVLYKNKCKNVMTFHNAIYFPISETL